MLTPAYLDDIARLPRGDRAAGEIELLQTRAEISDAIGEIADRVRAGGHPPTLATVGEVYRDQYVVLYRDAVRFRSGRAGTYLRMHFTSNQSGAAGVVAFVTRGREVLLKRSYRHATRAWELEMPRGFRDARVPVVQAAQTEMTEETGYHDLVGAPVLVGEFAPDTGLLGHTLAVVHLPIVGRPRRPELEEMESIDPTEQWFDTRGLDEAICEGRVRDGITLAAWALCRTKIFTGTE